MEVTHDLVSALSHLIQEHGLVTVLEALKELVETRAESLDHTPDQQEDELSEAFENVACALAVLIKALPEEIDVEMALEQATHSSSDFEPDTETLLGGLA